ncbi:hypothetical protein [Mycobacterium uberis]|uniref:hypothetical protein n=1 Tax=Mycobacterium uberis TaxID=2162698 RepID=UPI001FB27366|nr:hypothetical protein [Mycobacterium uberis]
MRSALACKYNSTDATAAAALRASAAPMPAHKSATTRSGWGVGPSKVMLAAAEGVLTPTIQ